MPRKKKEVALDLSKIRSTGSHTDVWWTMATGRVHTKPARAIRSPVPMHGIKPNLRLYV
jgi:hypothetical protein